MLRTFGMFCGQVSTGSALSSIPHSYQRLKGEEKQSQHLYENNKNNNNNNDNDNNNNNEDDNNSTSMLATAAVHRLASAAPPRKQREGARRGGRRCNARLNTNSSDNARPTILTLSGTGRAAVSRTRANAPRQEDVRATFGNPLRGCSYIFQSGPTTAPATVLAPRCPPVPRE
ncbi:unnamed protein product, partial [Iphiclides podalirius]